jgi:predicted nucleotidyltransferase
MNKDIYLEQIRKIILSRLKDYRFQLLLFGSQATQRSDNASDIDIAILPITPLPRGLLSEIREELEESCIPYPVDLVDLSKTSPDFVRHVKEEGIMWN